MSYASKARGTAVEETVAVLTNVAVVAKECIKRVWSKQQEKIYEWFAKGKGHLVVRARAGTGKTTTIIEGVMRAPERSILMAAFNKRIAEELQARIPAGHIEAKTLHAIGYMLIREYWPGCRVAKGWERESTLTRAVCKGAVPDTILKLVGKLHVKGREINPFATKPEDLIPLAEQFECEPDAFWAWQTPSYDLEYVCTKAFEAMQFAKNETNKPTTGIDFADMIYLPLVKGWAMGKYEMVVVDEAQDMTVAQLELARKVLAPNGRMCIVGDDRQAIYGFRGADSGSIDRLKRELDAKELGLTVTYRCGHSIVARAQEIVPDIEAHASNQQGMIYETDDNKLIDLAQPGDFILSRLNAPLAGVCMQLIREGKRAEIAGRDIAAGLKTLMRKVGKNARDVDTFIELLAAWEDKEVKRLTALKFETRLKQVRDQVETLEVLCEGLDKMSDVEQRLDRIFSDDGPNAARILCSSVHKAKGLEADRVFLLDWTFRDDRGNGEEKNIRYVAVTRAKHELVYVEGR